jgi:REP element-mobilizing transposase RayT
VRAALAAASKDSFQVVQFSVQGNHIHLIVEADDKHSLSSGLNGLAVRCARAINGALGRCGRVFADRYHLEVITSPTRARHALSYILNNWRKHHEDQQGLARTWLVDPFSSAISFPGWKELEEKDFMWPMRETYDPLIVRRPQSWLLREGWKLCGSVSARDVPSSRAR